MFNEQAFRWIFVCIVLCTLFVSAYHRRRARSSGETIQRSREGWTFIVTRLLVAVPLMVSIVAFMVRPSMLSWSTMPVPITLRWAGVLIGVGMLPFLNWTLSSLGKNVSETVLTKESHELICSGPYRWIRHPLYAGSFLLLIALSAISASWFILAMAVLAFSCIVLLVVPSEEKNLIRKFDARYEEYCMRTGRFLPRF